MINPEKLLNYIIYSNTSLITELTPSSEIKFSVLKIVSFNKPLIFKFSCS